MLNLTEEEVLEMLDLGGLSNRLLCLALNNEEIGLATVYRVLTQFEAAGLVIRHHFEEGHSVFELAGTSHHDHLVCIRCGRVEEFSDADIEALQTRIADKLGFELTDHNLNMYGYCPKCRTRA